MNGEPTESKLASGGKGAQRVIVRVRGREAHSAYAHLGGSALEPLLDLLPKLRDLPLPVDPCSARPPATSACCARRHQANIVPGLAEARS